MSTNPTYEQDPYGVHSLVARPGADPVSGSVRWDPRHSLWNGGMFLTALTLGPLTATWDAVLVFLLLSAITLCAGHSVGMHRRLIHRSFVCPLWVEHILVWLSTVVGMGGPLWTILTHDSRDWAQRQPLCHDYFAHRQGLLKDAWWNLHCRLELDRPPTLQPTPEIATDPFYRWLERTWMLQQVPIALALFLLGGWSWVVWGVCVRVTVCVTGHWFVGYFAHRQGPQTWLVEGAGVQAHDVPYVAILTMGESWHNNHHAFPASARHGLYPGQADPGWRFIQAMAWLGLAWNLRTPASLPPRHALIPAPRPAEARIRRRAMAALCPGCRQGF